MQEKLTDLETQVSLCILGNKDVRIKEYGISYCGLLGEHLCPYKDMVKLVKTKDNISLEYHLCSRWLS